MRLPAAIALLACLSCAVPSFAAPKHSLDSEHYRFFYDPDHLMGVDTVRISAEDAYRRISDRLDFDPKQRIPVVLYSNRKEFQRVTGIKRSELVLGTATSVDQVIRLDASEVFETPERVVGHETAHIFLNYYLGPYAAVLPLWMNEGLAQVLGGAYLDVSEYRVAEAVVHGELLSMKNLTIRFPEGEKNGLAYAQSHSAVAELLKNGGWPKMRELLGHLKAARSFDEAMKATYGTDAAGWEGRWRRHVKFSARFASWARYADWLVPAMMFGALAWGIMTIRRHKRKQIRDEEPVVEIEPPSWWKEDEFHR